MFGKARSINYVTIRDLSESENYTKQQLNSIVESIIEMSSTKGKSHPRITDYLTNNEIFGYKMENCIFSIKKARRRR